MDLVKEYIDFQNTALQNTTMGKGTLDYVIGSHGSSRMMSFDVGHTGADSAAIVSFNDSGFEVFHLNGEVPSRGTVTAAGSGFTSINPFRPKPTPPKIRIEEDPGAKWMRIIRQNKMDVGIITFGILGLFASIILHHFNL